MENDTQSNDLLEGRVERIVYRNNSNGYTVLRLAQKKTAALETVVGVFQEVAPGEQLRFSGEWVKDQKHGSQFKAKTCLPLLPSTLFGITKFLGSGLIPGIGKVMAERIVDKFGMDTLEIIERTPIKLTSIEGIGKVRAEAISKALIDNREVKNVMVFLESHGISPAYAYRIYKRYKNRAIQIVSENPYRLALDIHGIGFRMSDAIAANIGVPKNSIYRAEAGLLFVLEELAGEGHVFVPKEELLSRAENLLEMDLVLLEKALYELNQNKNVCIRGKNYQAPVYLPRLEEAEKDSSIHLKRLVDGAILTSDLNMEKAIKSAEKNCGIKFDSMQEKAFWALKKAKILILTGGPGTGKTTLLKGLISCFAKKTHQIVLAAPTGRAAKRMNETSGYTASTIHRLLEYVPKTGSFARCESNPLQLDLLVVDEVSMVDIELFASLLRAIPDNASLILVGDPDQLPSVGPGTVLSDLLKLDKTLYPQLSIVRLTEIFRQAQSSLIVTGAHEILKGHDPPMGKKGENSDLFMIERSLPEECLDVISNMVTKRIPSAFGFNPIDDIQVLTPMHKGLLGASNLNIVLQELLNPSSNALLFRGKRFCIGDKVMQIRNNYDLEVFNGDVGKICAMDLDNFQWLKVDYGFKIVEYPATELDQVTLAYACSVHKSQGSEYKAVVIPVHTQHFIMLQRNLIYTAITRGKKLVVMVGTKRALGLAIKNDSLVNRYSLLTKRIMEQ